MRKTAIVLVFTIIITLTACVATENIPVTTYPTHQVETVNGEGKPESITPKPTVTQEPQVWFDDNLPDLLVKQFLSASELKQTEDIQTADYQIIPRKGEFQIGQWQYYITVPFFCLQDGLSSHDFLNIWFQNSFTDPVQQIQWLMKPETAAMLTASLGNSQATIKTIETSDEILKSAWNDKTCSTWAIIPFEDLQKEWKIVLIDEQDPFSTLPNPLTIPIYANQPMPNMPVIRNLDIEKMTTLNMTGVTALVRATATTMEKKGILYPAEEIGDILRASDFTHISNEASFAENCPFPTYTMEELKFCSSPSHIALLEDIGTNIVELTGDHLEDWGIDALRYTLEMYNDRSWFTYGGGENLTAAQAPLLIEHNGNRLMFIGCNAKSPSYAHAAADYPGTWFCDWDIMAALIHHAHENNYLPIVTIQHKEYDQAFPTDEIVEDFHYLSNQGALIVIGSQAHQPQTFDFSTGNFIHYGMGNLFFDQYNESPENRNAFIDQFAFHENRLINIRLYTTEFVDWAKPRWMTPEERLQFLSRIFSNSNWNIDFE